MHQVMVNCATMYTVKDAVEVVRNKKISRSTILHHTCVVLAYLYVLNVLHGDYNVEGIFKVSASKCCQNLPADYFKCFIYYGAFTALNFPYKLFLATRFFVDRNSGTHTAMKTATLCHKVVCVLINFYWQMFYLRNSLWDVLKQGGAMEGKKDDFWILHNYFCSCSIYLLDVRMDTRRICRFETFT